MLPYEYATEAPDVPGIVYIVDDDPDVRDSLTWLLEANDYRVEDYESGETFIAQFNENVPSVILCDLRMPGMSGADVQEHLLRRRVDAPFIFITGHGDVPQAVEAFKRGAVDFIQKPFKQQQVKELVNRMLVRARETRRRRLILQQNRALIEKLTPREQQVLDRIVHGRLNKQIADDLGISIKTVEAHRASIMDKTGSGTVAHLMRVGVKLDLRGSCGIAAESYRTDGTPAYGGFGRSRRHPLNASNRRSSSPHGACGMPHAPFFFFARLPCDNPPCLSTSQHKDVP